MYSQAVDHRMKSSKHYSRQMIDKIAHDLANNPLPRRDALSKQAVIMELYPLIDKLKNQGHTNESIVLYLQEQGVSITVTTFKNYLSRAKKALKEHKRKQRPYKTIKTQEPEGDTLQKPEREHERVSDKKHEAIPAYTKKDQGYEQKSGRFTLLEDEAI